MPELYNEVRIEKERSGNSRQTNLKIKVALWIQSETSEKLFLIYTTKFCL